MSGKVALVTGATGFVAGHVVHQVLEAGYSVRGTVRGEKTQKLNEANKIPNFTYVRVDDIATSDLTEALNGVDVILHVASPLAGKNDPDKTLTMAVDGTLNVLRQAAAAGIKKVVITSSVAAVLDPGPGPGYAGLTFDESKWGQVTREEAVKATDPFFIYSSSKILAERAVWEFAKEHSEVDIATILPPFVYGPWASGFPLPGSPNEFGTNGFIYYLTTGKASPQTSAWLVDVRDVAKAHVRALNVPKVASGGNLEEKRFLVNGGVLTWKEAAEFLNQKRPEITTAKQEEFPAIPGPLSILDTTRSKEVLGMTDTIDPRQTVEDAIDSLIYVQKQWQ